MENFLELFQSRRLSTMTIALFGGGKPKFCLEALLNPKLSEFQQNIKSNKLFCFIPYQYRILGRSTDSYNILTFVWGIDLLKRGASRTPAQTDPTPHLTIILTPNRTMSLHARHYPAMIPVELSSFLSEVTTALRAEQRASSTSRAN